MFPSSTTHQRNHKKIPFDICASVVRRQNESSSVVAGVSLRQLNIHPRCSNTIDCGCRRATNLCHIPTTAPSKQSLSWVAVSALAVEGCILSIHKSSASVVCANLSANAIIRAAGIGLHALGRGALQHSSPGYLGSSRVDVPACSRKSWSWLSMSPLRSSNSHPGFKHVITPLSRPKRVKSRRRQGASGRFTYI